MRREWFTQSSTLERFMTHLFHLCNGKARGIRVINTLVVGKKVFSVGNMVSLILGSACASLHQVFNCSIDSRAVVTS